MAQAIWSFPVLASKNATAPNDRQPQRYCLYAHRDSCEGLSYKTPRIVPSDRSDAEELIRERGSAPQQLRWDADPACVDAEASP